MKTLNKLVRKNIQNLEAYSSARDEFDGKEGVFLDANENPYGEENRYPDPYQKTLKQKLSAVKQINANQIFIGNGSDEIIDLAFRIFCNPGQDKVLTFSPTYGMYKVSANINDVELIEVPLTENFQIDLDKTNPFLKDINLKMIFICSPNNPTGNLIDTKEIDYLLQNFNGIIIIDEAYIDFSSSKSWIKKLNQFENLIVLQTFSKAWGLANSRVGVAYMNPDLIYYFNKVKPPYNVSGLNQNSALKALSKNTKISLNLLSIKEQKIKLEQTLNNLEYVLKIFPSDTNFLLVEVTNANELYQKLITHRLIIRNRHNVIKNCVRITIGTPFENQKLIKALKNIKLN